VSLDERPRGSTWPTPKVHYNSLPRTSIEGALGAVLRVPSTLLGPHPPGYWDPSSAKRTFRAALQSPGR
jgi:hypothetical protein